MLQEEQKELIEVFGERVAFHRLETMLYSGDLSTLPEFLKDQICTIPDAVVQPVSTDELTTLLNIAVKYKTPLIPRGAGTASYGGAIPTMGGIVVDFHRMKKVVKIDKEKRTVVVQPGVVWKELDKELHLRGLALRLYPSSAISSTVGGWLGNGGGVGMGSFEYGYFKESVLEAEIVTPEGTKRLKGDQVDLVYGMAGTTGLISEVTIMTRDNEDDIPLLAAFASPDGLLGALEEVKGKKLALWDVSYRGPLHVQLNREAAKKQAKRALVPHAEDEPQLPADRFIATFVYPKSRETAVKDDLLGIIDAHGGKTLEEGLARSAWDERFYPIRLIALGPSFLFSEVILPTENLLLIDDMRARMEGMAVSGTLIDCGKETVVRIYVLGDECHQDFSRANLKSLLPGEAVERLGGRPYAVGMYFTGDAELVLDKAKLLKVHVFKNEVDPLCIMNPGKVFPLLLHKDSTKRLDWTIELMGERKGLDDNEESSAKPKGAAVRENTLLENLPLGKEVIWDAFTCAKCGYCHSVCPQFGTIGWESASPRGKFKFIREYLKGNVKLDERMAEMFFVCTTCRQCNKVCQVKAPIDEDWSLTMRQALLEEGFHPPLIFQRQAHNILFNHNPGGYPQSKRKAWITSDLKYTEEGEICFFAGCAATFTYGLRNLPINAVRILNRAGIEPAYLGPDEWCCGGPLFSIGFIKEVLETVRHNIEEINRRGIKTLITSCSGGWLYLNHFYRLLAKRLGLEYNISVKHITEVIPDLIAKGRIKCERPVNLKVTYHDPCHIGRGGNIFDPPRKILASIPGLELVEMPRNREHSSCCGRNIMRYPRLGGAINMSRVTEAIETGAPALVTCCPTCENNLRRGIVDAGAKMEVLDISDLVAESMGLPRLAVSNLAKLLRKQR